MTNHVGYAGAEELTGIKRGTLYSLVNQRKIPHIRIGKRHVLFSVQELRDWLERHRVGLATTDTRGCGLERS